MPRREHPIITYVPKPTITFRRICRSTVQFLAFELSEAHSPSLVLSFPHWLVTIYHRKCHGASPGEIEKKLGSSLLLRGVKRFTSLKAGSPCQASALSNAIRFVGEKDEGDSRGKRRERERGGESAVREEGKAGGTFRN